MAQREPRYWTMYPAVRPGDEVAVHDGGVGLDNHRPNAALASGPGNYQVVVRRPGAPIPGSPMPERWPIELRSTSTTGLGFGPMRFNPGMARWFGLRLIEAAAICEAFDVAGGATVSVAPSEIEKLSTFLTEHLGDQIGEGSAVDNAIRLLQLTDESD